MLSDARVLGLVGSEASFLGLGLAGEVGSRSERGFSALKKKSYTFS